MKLMLINGSVREGRRADRVMNWVAQVLGQEPDLELDIVDLKEVDLPFFDEAVSPSDNNGNYKNPKGTAWAQRIGQADAFIMVTPEYNHTTSAVLKNAIDWVYGEWIGKPLGLIGYGGMVAGSRAVQHLKQIALAVGLHPVLGSVHIPHIGTAFDENGRPIMEGLDDGLRRLVKEVTSLHAKLKS